MLNQPESATAEKQQLKLSNLGLTDETYTDTFK